MESIRRNDAPIHMDLYQKAYRWRTFREKNKDSTWGTSRSKNEKKVTETWKKHKKKLKGEYRRGFRNADEYWNAMTYVVKSFNWQENDSMFVLYLRFRFNKKILCCLSLIWIVDLNSQIVSTTSHKISSVVGGVNLIIPFYPSSCSYFPLRYMTTVAKVVQQQWFNVDHLLTRDSSTIIPNLIGKPLVAKVSRLGILCNWAIIHECRRHG